MEERIWPAGIRAAVSLTFDDARPSQLEVAIPTLDRHGLKGTFYVLPSRAEGTREQWRRAAQNGHEVGNHTLRHPCTGNYDWSRQAALEDYTLRQMREEIAQADDAIEAIAGVRPTSFAYPCGQRFVGRGTEVASYVPLIAERYLAGRGARDRIVADPAWCDLAQIPAVSAEQGVERIKAGIHHLTEAGSWLVLVWHDVQRPPLDQLAAQLAGREDLWIGTVSEIAAHIQATRDAA